MWASIATVCFIQGVNLFQEKTSTSPAEGRSVISCQSAFLQRKNRCPVGAFWISLSVPPIRSSMPKNGGASHLHVNNQESGLFHTDLSVLRPSNSGSDHFPASLCICRRHIYVHLPLTGCRLPAFDGALSRSQPAGRQEQVREILAFARCNCSSARKNA